jgi:NTE family protein
MGKNSQKKLQQLQAHNDHLQKSLRIHKLSETSDEFLATKEKKDYEYLVLSGGGVKGISFVGALWELNKMGVIYDENNKLKLKGFAAASAGSIIATLLAVGYSIDELNKIMLDLDFANIVDDKIGYIRDSYNFITKYGICKGQYLYNFIGELIKEKTGNPDYTFKQLYTDKNIKLVMSVTNLTLNKTIYLHPQHADEMYSEIPIRVGVRMSSSVPFLFEPYMYNNCLFVDGGMLDNYPIDVFDVEDPNNMDELYLDVTPNYKTLGLKIIANTHNNECNIHNIYDYTCSYVETFLSNNDKKSYIKVNWDRTVFISVPNYPLTKFDLNDKQKSDLIEDGINGVINYFN